MTTLNNNCSIDFTYNFNMSSFSFLDHFIVSENVYASFIDSCSVRHHGDNLSDHDPITLSLTIDWSTIDLFPRHYASKCKWHKANADDLLSYKRSFEASIDSLFLPVDVISCQRVTYDNRLHFVAINYCSNGLIIVCLDSAKHTIPHTAQTSDVHHNNVMPGWNEYVAPLYYGTISGSNVVVHMKELLLVLCLELGHHIIMRFAALKTINSTL